MVQDAPGVVIGRLAQVAALAAALAAPAARAADSPSAQGVLRGSEEALLSSEMPGKILRIAEDGDSFRKGDTLVEFACDLQRAEEDMAQAAVQGARAQADNQKRLDALKSGGQLDLAMAQAKLGEEQARERGGAAKVRLCRVAAPYDGVVLRREARPYESVNLMAPLLRVARRGKLEVVVIAPAAWLQGLKVGMPFVFATPAGQQVEGKLIRLGAAVDSASQTFEPARRAGQRRQRRAEARPGRHRHLPPGQLIQP
ncbi:MAG: HlyD family efflux transporter periplasmic adaptor subunit [Magnetospirillum sp.]|nr:HlyD family efflux transporter periplasmic adaptor subunit [Magnetospirillum sp.]